MTVSERVEDLLSWRGTLPATGTVGFVPTMGALHPGHLSLLREAREACDFTVVSIFVNPTQFNQEADLVNYPRSPDTDILLLKSAGCDHVFAPEVREMYPEGLQRGHWDYGLLTSVLEARFRPGHFDGVLTVVGKLLDLVQPTHLFMGEKDFQQLAVIRRLIREEKRPIRLVGCPTVREGDGLAMSSRNARLSPGEREAAAAIPRILGEMDARRGEFDPPALEQWGRAEFHRVHGLRLEYLEVVDAHTFGPVAEWGDTAVPVILCAAYAGEVRLIDNLPLWNSGELTKPEA